jgi:hypothetical protein
MKTWFHWLLAPKAAVFAAGVLLLPTLTACGAGTSGAGGTTRSPAASGGASASASGSTPGASPSGSAAPSRSGGTSGGAAGGSTPQTATQVSVYFLHDGKLSPAHRQVTGVATARGALTALLSGPSGNEQHAGRSTAIPPGTGLNGISVHSSVATVDLTGRFASGGGSASMRARLAQVVFTATQFPGIRSVQLWLDGRAVTAFGGEGIVLDPPVTRSDFEDVAPAVLVESPAIGDTVRSPVRVQGSANVFEAVFRLRLTDPAGAVLADVRVTASSGTGTRGTFDVSVPYHATRAGTGTLIAYYLSAKDGSQVVVERIPVGIVP